MKYEETDMLDDIRSEYFIFFDDLTSTVNN